MSNTLSPVAYTSDFETPSEGEAAAVDGLKEVLGFIQETTSHDYGVAVRALHAKAHGIVRGRLRIHGDLPPPFAQGLFEVPAEHDAVLRFSTNPGDILDDEVSAPRGLALKVLGVQGARLPESPEADTQDFVFANAPAFGAADPQGFLKLLRLLAPTTDKGEAWKKRLSRVLVMAQTTLHAVGAESRVLTRIGGAPNVHPLGETYFSQTPFLYGRNVAKFQLVPISAGLKEVVGMHVHTHGRPDALREDVSETMIEQGGVWELRVQLNVDPDAMPIEDASAVWSTELSPYVAVATLTVPPQSSWKNGVSDTLDQRLAFNIWNGLAAHRPLGGINRARKPAYASSAGYRSAFNGCPVHEAVDFSQPTKWESSGATP